MLHILLLILKIVGIILAVIIGIILLALLALLFVPIRYSIEASYKEKPLAKIKANWLLHLVRFHFLYDKQSIIQMKILCFNVYGKKEKKSAKSRKHKPTREKRQEKSVFESAPSQASMKSDVNIPKVDNSKESIDSKDSPNLKKSPNSNASQIDNTTSIVTPEIQTTEHVQSKRPKSEKKKSLLFKLKEIIFLIYGRIKDIIHSIFQLKETATEKLQAFKDAWNNPDYRNLIKFLWTQFQLLMKKIRPRKYKINLTFGMEDPYDTGQIAMYAAVIYGLLGLDMNIIPDFEQERFEGDILLKGRFRLFRIVLIGIRVYRNKLFKKIILKSGS